MKIEIESQDIEAIARRVSDIIKPLIAPIERADGGNGNDAVFDVEGLAQYLQVKPSWIYKQVSLRAIPYFKTGKYPRFKRKDINRWIDSQTARPVPSLELMKNRGRPPDSVSNASKKLT